MWRSLVSAPALGAGGRRFESGHPDQLRAHVDLGLGLRGRKHRHELESQGIAAHFVSIMSEQGVPVEEIARLVGHSTTATTEAVYRRELRPVISTGAEVMDTIFKID